MAAQLGISAVKAAEAHIICIFTCVVVLIWLTGCNPGQPAPSGYHCGTPCCGHCYAIAIFSDGKPKAYPADQSSEIFGYKTYINVTTGMASGDGFIDDEIWLKAFDGPGWIEAGYKTDSLGQHYFWAENDETTGIFVQHFLGPIPQADVDNYVWIEIFNDGVPYTTSPLFSIVILGNATNSPTFFRASTSNAMWSTGQDKFAEVNFGQELQGSSGALANNAFFIHNSWMDSTGVWRVRTADTEVQINKPPYGGWIMTPSSTAQPGYQPDGGWFFTECCQPP